MKIFPLVLSILLLSSTIALVVPAQGSFASFPDELPGIKNIFVTYDLSQKSLEITWDPIEGSCFFQVRTDYFSSNSFQRINPVSTPQILYFPISCNVGELIVDMKEYTEYEDADFTVSLTFSNVLNAPWQVLLLYENPIFQARLSDKCNLLYTPQTTDNQAQLWSILGAPPTLTVDEITGKTNFTATTFTGVYSYKDGRTPTLITINHPSPNVNISNSLHDRLSEIKDLGFYACDIVIPPQSCNDCVPPTLGVMNNGKRIVDNGFSYNGQSVDVERWYTPFPLITATVGELNLVEIKVFENFGINNMEMVQFGLGLEYQGQPLNDLEVLIEVHLLTDGTKTGVSVEDIIIIDKENLIENDSVSSIAYAVKCQVSDKTDNCVKVDLYYSYREATINNMMLVSVSDKVANTQNFHFNEGVQVIGKSLNPPLIHTIFNERYSQHGDLWLTFTRVDKVNDIWTDQNDIVYHKVNDNTFDRITAPAPSVCADPPLDEIMNGGTRNNCHFRELVPSIWKH